MDNGIDEKLLIARAEDTAVLCERQYSVKFMGFLSPAESSVISRNMPSGDVIRIFFGGYPEAERKLFVALPEYAEETDAEELIAVLEITGREIDALTHRDFLGSLLGLGIRREKIGDILVYEDKTLVFVLEDIADYIILNLQKVGRCGIKIRRMSIEEIEIPKRRVELINATVASMRLDCIAAAALRLSRSKVLDIMAEGRVSLNWTECKNPSAVVKTGDTLSIRGTGRFRVSEEVRETKKGRLAVGIEKML